MYQRFFKVLCGRAGHVASMVAGMAVYSVVSSGVALAVEVGDDEQFIPVISFRTGPFAATGISFTDGFLDYLDLLNLRDGGIDNIKIVYEECEFGYDVDRGIECYERLKDKGKYGAPAFYPYSTGVAYALLERSRHDRIPLITIGYGRPDTTDGRVFPYSFPLITNYWSQSSAKIRFIAQSVGGDEGLRGLHIVNLYLKGAYGQETMPVLNKLAQHYGFTITHIPITYPGLDQKAAWLQISEINPDWIINRSLGAACSVALREAQRVGIAVERIIGVWWCGSEEDVIPAGLSARGYISTTYNGTGQDFPVLRSIARYVHSQPLVRKGASAIGSTYYNRGVISAIVLTEAIRYAQSEFGQRPLGGKEVQWALERLDLNDQRLAEIGAQGLMPAIKTSWLNHEGSGKVLVQRWNGAGWERLSQDWILPYTEIVEPMIKASALQYAEQKGITLRESIDDGL